MKPFTEDQRKAIQDQLKQFESDVPEEIHSDVETFVDKMCIWASKNTEKMGEEESNRHVCSGYGEACDFIAS